VSPVPPVIDAAGDRRDRRRLRASRRRRDASTSWSLG
jgi:hypothetical protein